MIMLRLAGRLFQYDSISYTSRISLRAALSPVRRPAAART
jgi:hypothetical protein